MSSEPPPCCSRSPGPAACRGASACSPSARGFFSSFCSAFASCWSSSLHFGRPTFWMFAQVVSATTLLKCCRPGAAEHLGRLQLDAGHHRRGLGDRVAGLPHLLDVREVGLAEVVPDRRGARDDVGLIAAVGDHVVRALAQAQVLAAEVPADVHQLDGVERAAAAPRRRRRRARSRRGTNTGPRPARCRRALPHDTSRSSPTCVKSATSTSLKSPARMKYALVPTSSSAVPGQIRIVPGQVLALHDLLHGDRGGDVAAPAPSCALRRGPAPLR